MTTQLHLTADRDVWSGASSRALYAAAATSSPAMVLTAMTDAGMLRRYDDAAVDRIYCKSTGLFAALNLSRVLRRIPGDAFRLYVHSPEALSSVEYALKLVGRDEPFALVAHPDEPILPPVEVKHPAANAAPLLMWLGNITPDCGLRELIDRLGESVDKHWQLRVVGQGKAKHVTPIIRRTKALGIDKRVEWTGYSCNPFGMMDGVSVGIVTKPGSFAAREFAAASIPILTDINDLHI